MGMLWLSRRCHEQLAVWGTVLGVVVALVACGAQERAPLAAPESSARVVPESLARGAPEGSMAAVPVEVRVLHAIAPPVATTAASPVVTPVLPKVAPSPFELVGTSISATNTFAVLKEADQSMLTVHEGDRIDGYTIAAIAPDRVKVRSPDNSEQLLMLLAATGNAAAPMTRTSGAAPEPLANTALIAAGINTDQSIPEDVTFGPTGSLPEGMKQMGH
jgi:hypothetical protein